jgi:hypothetical protein
VFEYPPLQLGFAKVKHCAGGGNFSAPFLWAELLLEVYDKRDHTADIAAFYLADFRVASQ